MTALIVLQHCKYVLDFAALERAAAAAR